MKLSLLFGLALASSTLTAAPIEVIRNEKIVAYNETLQPAGSDEVASGLPNVTVYATDGTVETIAVDGQHSTVAVRKGEAVYRIAGERLSNAGTSELRLVRVDFLGAESKVTWGLSGLAPDYRMLLENGHARVYDIRIAAATSEPQHTHQDRVIIGLSGAQLRHLLPDGQTVDSNLKTGEVAWRRGQTHIGQNVGKTDLWAIAVEPK